MVKFSPPDQVLEEDLHGYVDGVLDPVRRKEVQAYLDRHPDAAASVAKLAAQRQLLRSALASIADERVPERLDLSRLVVRHRDKRPWAWRMAATVLVALGVGGFSGWQARDFLQPSAGIAALAGEALSSYVAYAGDSVPEEDRTQLASLVSAKLKQRIDVPDLTRSGYRYAGGRLVATVHGPAGLFFYDRADGTRLAMMVRPMAREREASMRAQSTGSIGGYTWAARGLGYSVVGTEAPEVLHPVANEVRRQVGARQT